MNGIVLAVLLVGGIGLIAGVGLAIASIVMAVPRDEKADAVEELLPGANCGACGYSGCAGYAAALAKGEAKPGQCSPGGKEVADKVAALLGVAGGDVEYKTALVHCMGSYDNTTDKMIYQGQKSCPDFRRCRPLSLRLHGAWRLRRRLRIRCDHRLQRRGVHRPRKMPGLLQMRCRLSQAFDFLCSDEIAGGCPLLQL